MKRFDQQGILAIDPQAFFGFFAEDQVAKNESAGLASVVSIRGPLVHHRGGWFDSYEAIRERVQEACAGPAKAVVLLIDSPGGDVSGCFDTARALRAMCAAAGKQLVAYIDGSVGSAAYALAASAERIVASPTAAAGSVGIIATRLDTTGADEKWGVKYSLLTSGSRKTYGNQHVAMDESEAVETQAVVDWLAGQFFDLVAEYRGMDAKAVADLEAGTFRGPAAVEAGLVDELGTLEELLASLSNDNRPAGRSNEDTMDEDEKKIRDAAQAVLDDDNADEKAKAKARKALAAMDDEDEEKAEDDESETKDEEEAKAAASPDAIRALVRTEMQAAQAADRAKAEEAAQRAELLASRPDLDEPTRAILATAPIDQVRSYVESAPRRALKPAATAVVGATPAEGQAGNGRPGQARGPQSLAVLMGVETAESPGPRVEGNRQTFPVMNRSERAKYCAERTRQAEAKAS